VSGNFLPFLADRVLNRPMLLHPDKAAMVMNVLEGRIAIGSVEAALTPEASRFVGTGRRADGSHRRFTRASGNTALITVDGSLVNRGAWVGASSGLTSYEGLAAQLDEIAAERDIQNVVIDMNSYGGEATGMFALAAKIRSLRQSKHVVAVVNDVAASAGYGIVSAADRIMISPTSLVGSIGVVMMHVDRSAELAAKGLRPTLIHAGAKKVDGNPFGPLPENVRADMQKDVLAFYDRFLETVEMGRTPEDKRKKPRLTAQQARETEADVYIGQEAIDAGLADAMGTLDEVLAELSRPTRSAGRSTQQKGATMDRENLPGADAGNMVTQTALQAAVMKAEADGKVVGANEAKPALLAEGAKGERERISAIMALPEAEKRQGSALKMALDPAGLSAETVKGVLAGLPEENAPSAAKPGASTPPISERATEGREIGQSGQRGMEAAAPEATKAGWAKAFNRAA
jgi:signal peptide peptidase SppA